MSITIKQGSKLTIETHDGFIVEWVLFEDCTPELVRDTVARFELAYGGVAGGSTMSETETTFEDWLVRLAPKGIEHCAEDVQRHAWHRDVYVWSFDCAWCAVRPVGGSR